MNCGLALSNWQLPVNGFLVNYGHDSWTLLSNIIPYYCRSIVSGIVFFDLQSYIEFDADGQYYEVNGQGVLTIHLKGEIVNIALDDCEFQLTIPEEYKMTSLSNGTPVIRILNEGAPLETAINDSEFHSVFMLKVYNSTALPINYNLKIGPLGENSEQTITQRWLAPLGGGGASISMEYHPYITSFYAYDSYKGNTEKVSTYIYNPNPFLSTGYME